MKKMMYSILGFSAFASQLMADGAESPAAKEGNFSQTLMMIAIALVFFYFILWRPEQKRRKALEKQRSSLQVGSRVTAMGIIGTVAKIQDNSVILKMYDGAKIEVLKAAITDVQAGGESTEAKSDKTIEISDTSK